MRVESTLNILLRILLTLDNLCQVGGSAYFAFFVNHQLRPYLTEHAQVDGDVHTAHLVYVYLCVSAVLCSISLVACLGSLCKGGVSSEKQEKQLSCSGIISRVIFSYHRRSYARLRGNYCKLAWTWWKQFETDGQDVLARNCHRLAGMMVALLALSAGYLILLAFIFVAIGLAKCSRDQRMDKTVLVRRS
ncbi:hypothetical protein DL771_007412 [Monosporascus sp. 5C6A]|nr:hypothetical protein DL771_007412 [Monosporascus sp. 5C6A]